jgi:hypothetical protein
VAGACGVVVGAVDSPGFAVSVTGAVGPFGRSVGVAVDTVVPSGDQLPVSPGGQYSSFPP